MKVNHWHQPFRIDFDRKGTTANITVRRRHPMLFWMLLRHPVTVSRWNPLYWRVVIPAAIRLWRGAPA